MKSSAHPASSDRRGTDRTLLGRQAVLRFAGDSFPISVHDLAIDACKIVTGIRLEPGSRITLCIAGVGQKSARVVRADAEGYGCLFDEPLSWAAVVAATRDNVSHIQAPIGRLASPSGDGLKKWPLRNRALFILGASALSWGIIAAIAVLLW